MITRSNFLRKGQEYDPFTIRRNMRKPVIVLVVCDLLLSAAVRLHPPDLHRPATNRVEVDVFAIGTVLRAIVQPFSSRKPDLFATLRGYFIDVKLSISFSG